MQFYQKFNFNISLISSPPSLPSHKTQTHSIGKKICSHLLFTCVPYVIYSDNVHVCNFFTLVILTFKTMETTSQDFLPCNLKQTSTNNSFLWGWGYLCACIYIRVILHFLLSNFFLLKNTNGKLHV